MGEAMEKKHEQYDVVIIGGGAAGLSAGIYAGRAGLKTLIIEKTLIGGLANNANEISNYPGFPEEISGEELMKLFKKQAEKFGVKFKLTDVKKVDLIPEDKTVETFSNIYHARAVIVASGGQPRLTGAAGEERFLYGRGISFCATCDADHYIGKHVLIVGSGDAAIEEGIFLTRFTDQVTVSVMHSEGVMDAGRIVQAQALANPKMKFRWNTVVDSFVGKEELTAVVLKNIKTGELSPVEVDGCFLFIGYEPDTELFKEQLPMTADGYLVTDEQMQTGVPGVFAAGDVRQKFIRQVSTAVGDGAIAGAGAEKHIYVKDGKAVCVE
jgi:thioredoxin reductase (NADPH)